jgi:hypothetical protein
MSVSWSCIRTLRHLKHPSAHILAPGAHARMPLVDRIAALKIPVSFVCTYSSVYRFLSLWLRSYADGEHDWMDPRGGVTSIDNLKAAGNDRARMYIVPHAGHHGKPLVYRMLSLLALTLVFVKQCTWTTRGR